MKTTITVVKEVIDSIKRGVSFMKNKLSELSNHNLVMNYKKTDDIFADMQDLIETTQKAAYSAVNTIFIRSTKHFLRFSAR